LEAKNNTDEDAQSDPVAEDRDRMALNLHADIAPTLTVVGAELATLEVLLADTPHVETTRRIRKRVQCVLEDVTGALRDLRLGNIRNTGVVSAMEELVANLSGCGINTTLVHRVADLTFSPSASLELYRLIASSCSILKSTESGCLSIELFNDDEQLHLQLVYSGDYCATALSTRLLLEQTLGRRIELLQGHMTVDIGESLEVRLSMPLGSRILQANGSKSSS